MSLDSLVSAAAGNDLKFVFVGGKGGVGTFFFLMNNLFYGR